MGIKSENHTGSIYILFVLLGMENVFTDFDRLKDNRIKYQYYINKDENEYFISKECLFLAKNLIIELNDYFNNLNEDKIKEIRKKFEDITSSS